MSGKRKTRKNAGEGYGYMFSGAFAKKADAVKKEKQRKGSFVKAVFLPSGMRYAVMTPRDNPPKRKKKAQVLKERLAAEKQHLESQQYAQRVRGNNPVFFDAGIQKYTAHRYDKKFGNVYASGHTKKEALKNLRDRLREYRQVGMIDAHRGYAQNPSELLIMGANPSKQITVPAGAEITIRVNPEPNPYFGFGPGQHTKQELAASRRSFKANVRAKAKDEQEYVRGLRRSARRTRGQAKLDQLFHEVYGPAENPTRTQLLNLIRTAAAQNDTAKLTRLYVENRISRPVFDEAVRDGRNFGAFIQKRDNPVCGHMIGGYPCSRKPGHRGPHLPQGATMRTRHRLPKNWQPNPTAGAIREKFTGMEVDRVRVMQEPHMPAGNYAMLGKLLSLYVKPCKGGQVLEIQASGGTIVVADESARQIYFVGGEQDVSAGLQTFGAVDRGAGLFELGEARRIDYQQRKEHVPHPEHDSWRHEFGEESGVRPKVLFDARSKRLLLEGGAYEIRPEGIVN